MSLTQLRAALSQAVSEADNAKSQYGATSIEYCLAVEAVEEISVALHDRKQNTLASSFEQYCIDNPSEVECRIYEV